MTNTFAEHLTDSDVIEKAIQMSNQAQMAAILQSLRKEVAWIYSPITNEDKENGWRVYYEGKNEGIKEVLSLIDTKLNDLLPR